MKEGRLDGRTQNTFKWIKNRPTAAEREEMENASNGTKSPEIIKRDQRADKGRISRIKIKVWQVISRPRAERKKLVGQEWYLLMNKIDPREAKKWL